MLFHSLNASETRLYVNSRNEVMFGLVSPKIELSQTTFPLLWRASANAGQLLVLIPEGYVSFRVLFCHVTESYGTNK